MHWTKAEATIDVALAMPKEVFQSHCLVFAFWVHTIQRRNISVSVLPALHSYLYASCPILALVSEAHL